MGVRPHEHVASAEGSRIGAARVLRPFDDYDVKATIYACDRALERNPDIARPVLDTVARAGAGSPWLELALRAPWQGGQPGGHRGMSHRRTRTADRFALGLNALSSLSLI